MLFEKKENQWNFDFLKYFLVLVYLTPALYYTQD